MVSEIDQAVEASRMHATAGNRAPTPLSQSSFEMSTDLLDREQWVGHLLDPLVTIIFPLPIQGDPHSIRIFGYSG